MVILTDPRDEDDILRAKRSREKRYMFDIAFDSYNTQLDVYLATTKPLINSVLDGFNATVFAYGPTGALCVSLTLRLCASLTFTPTDL
jgi:kinesin family protein 18/19